MQPDLRKIAGSVTTPRGFRAASVSAGIKTGRRDMALVVSDQPAAVAGVFTTNRVQAAPVRLCRARLAGGQGRAVIINSGNANACTGARGARDAETMARRTAQLLGVPPRTVFVCSTGTIGIPLPMDKIERGIRLAVRGLAPDGGAAAAAAIMTTDTCRKQAAVRLELGGRPVTLAGMAKGAGMINPHMATMLAVLTSDAAVEPRFLQASLSAAVEQSFNRITVDGDQSTNDTVLVLANGAAGNPPLSGRHPERGKFRAALNAITRELALMIVRDGEGATKLVTVTVRNATSRRAAELVARAVANSLLVKTSWFGADPNWGRVICAVGYAGAPVRPELVDIAYDGQPAVRAGQSAGLPEKKLHAIIARPEFRIDIDLHLGKTSSTVYTCDCSDRYVHINAAYMT